jgi:hypothetical protein
MLYRTPASGEQPSPDDEPLPRVPLLAPMAEMSLQQRFEFNGWPSRNGFLALRPLAFSSELRNLPGVCLFERFSATPR